MIKDFSRYLIVLGIGLVLLFLYFTWPAGVFFAISSGLWFVSRRSKKLWVQAIGYVLSAVTVTLGILCFALFVLNAFKRTFNPNWVRSAEESLYVLLLYLRIITPSTVAMILILLALTAVTYYLPRWKLPDKFLWLKKSLPITILVLAAITSFIFFGQLSMKGWAVETHKQLFERYRAALRQEWQSEGRYLSAMALEKHVRDLDEPRREYFRLIYSTIKAEAFREMTDYTTAISEHMADLQSTRTGEVLTPSGEQKATASEVKLAEEELMELLPRTAGERSRQLEVLADQEWRARTAEAKAAEAFKGLKKVFSEVVTSQPGLDYVAGLYLKKLVSNYSELLFEKSVEQYHRKAAQAGAKAPVLAAEMVEAVMPEPQVAKQLLEPRIGSGMAELSVTAGLAAASPLLRTQVEQEVQRVTRVEATKAINNQIAKNAGSLPATRPATADSSDSYRRPVRVPVSRPRLRRRGR